MTPGPVTEARGLGRPNGAPIRCLVVEDEWLIALYLQDVLEERGAAVVGVTATGDRAIELADEHRPDVVLMDIALRGETDGVDAARAILERWGIPVIFLSAFNDETTRARIAALHGPELLIKPTSGFELEAAIRRACGLPPTWR